MTREEKERRVFFAYAAIRLAGLATFLFGIAAMFTDIVRPGGWPVLGAVMIIVGVLDAVILPPILRRKLEKQWELEGQ